MQVFEVAKEKERYISETEVVNTLQEAPLAKEIKSKFKVQVPGDKVVVLLIHNDTDQEQYFYAVPHELNPHHASAGHYFECLCSGRVYVLPPKKFWYRIARVNLNSTFGKLDTFDINHKVIGLDKAAANSTFKDRLYEK